MYYPIRTALKYDFVFNVKVIIVPVVIVVCAVDNVIVAPFTTVTVDTIGVLATIPITIFGFTVVKITVADEDTVDATVPVVVLFTNFEIILPVP